MLNEMMHETRDECKVLETVEKKLLSLEKDKASVAQHKKLQYYCEDVFAKKDIFQEYTREQTYLDNE